MSEWSYRAADSGLPNTWPPLFPTLDSQAQRAAAYERFATSLRANPAVVGQHWFEHADEPPAGRPGGEDSNFGLVDLADDPYQPMIDISKTMHDCAYAQLLDPPPTSTTSTTSTTPTSTTAVTSATTTSTTGRPITTEPTGPGPANPAAAQPVVAQPMFTG